MGLTSLRFFAALYVVIFHIWRELDRAGTLWPDRLAMHGYVGVSFFFVLSGFILVHAHPEAELDIAKFMAARVARIYPLFLTGWILVAPFVISAAIEKGPLPTSLLEIGVSGLITVFLGQAWLPWADSGWNAPGWSLSVEAALYLSFPFFLIRLRSVRDSFLALLAPGLWVASMIAPAAYLWIRPDGINVAGPQTQGFWLTGLKFNPVFHLIEFLFGMVLGVGFTRGRGFAWGARRWVGLSVVATAALVFALSWVPGWAYPFVHNGALMPVFGVLIYSTALDRGAFSRMLRWRPLVLLGRASFALYILQEPVSRWWGALSHRIVGHRSDSMTSIAVFVIVLLACSVVAHKLVEESARRGVRRLFESYRRRAGSSAAS